MDAVKPPTSRARSTLRAERAQATRRRIAAAARRLFARDGYAATTLRDVATEAGVAVQTVYAVYGSKAGIMRALRDLATDQPEAGAAFAQAMQQQTAGESLALFARSIRLRWELAGDIVTILGDAATADAAIHEEVEVALRTRRAGVAKFVTAIHDRFGLAIDPERGTAITLALTMPELHAELVGVSGWTEDAYEAWLAVALRRELAAGR